MRALVISGGGSKGAFAGGVAEYLMKKKGKDYDLFVGTSTGSLMVSHLALGEIDKLFELYTNVSQRTIFSNNPFSIKNIDGHKVININHLNVMWNFLKGRRTFGESKNLRKLIKKHITKDVYLAILNTNKDVIVTVSNITRNTIEYKSIRDCSYEDFCDWIWGSCNYVPFMSILKKDNCEYADGGFGALVPIHEAIKRGAKEVDVIILETEINQLNRISGKNPFSLMLDVFSFMLDHVEKHNITIGKLSAIHKDVQLNLYYTPTVLTTNSLVFDKKLMAKWWKYGFEHAKSEQHKIQNKIK